MRDVMQFQIILAGLLVLPGFCGCGSSVDSIPEAVTNEQIEFVEPADAPTSKREAHSSASSDDASNDSIGEPSSRQTKSWIDISRIYRTQDGSETFAHVVLDNRAGIDSGRGNFIMAAADQEVETLPDQLYEALEKRCLHAEELIQMNTSKAGLKEAFLELNEVLERLPEPAKKWNASGWILSRLGEIYFRIGAYEESLPLFDDLMWSPGTIGNPWLHLRKGQVLFEVNQPYAALQELLRAYMGGEKEIFQREDPKYYEFLRSKVDGIME